MIQVDLNRFAQAIMKNNPEISEKIAYKYAQTYQEKIHKMLEPSVNDWINGAEIQDASFAHDNDKGFSIQSIMSWRQSKDYLEAFLLLSEYIEDAKKGKAHILAPIRTHR